MANGYLDLDKIKKLTVLSMDWTFNQARALQAHHDIRADSTEALAEGTLVSYTDPDLDDIFYGWITKATPSKKGGEGIDYVCADLGRLLQKQPAYAICPQTCPQYSFPPTKMGSTKIHIWKGTKVSDAILCVINVIRQTGYLFLTGGVVIDPAVGDVLLKADIDKGGQTITSWLDDILDQTPGGVFTIDWVAGLPRLLVYDYYAKSAVTLTEGIRGKTRPTHERPLLVESDVSVTSDGKYRNVLVEGGGVYLRKTQMDFDDPPYDLSDCAVGLRQRGLGDGDIVGIGKEILDSEGHSFDPKQYIFYVRWYLPETNCLDQYIINPNIFDETVSTISSQLNVTQRTVLGCARGVYASFDVTTKDGDAAPTTTSLIYQIVPLLQDLAPTDWVVPATPNSRFKRWYVEFAFGPLGETGAHVRPPMPTFANEKFRYTVFVEPLVVKAVSTDPRLSMEGEFPIQHSDLYKYNQDQVLYPEPPYQEVEPAVHLDPTDILQAEADAQFDRLSNKPMISGKDTIHITRKRGTKKMITITPGMQVTNHNGDVRIRSVSYDFIARNITLEVSDQPLRDKTTKAKDIFKQESTKHFNWTKRIISGVYDPNDQLKAVISGCLPNAVLDPQCHRLTDSNTPNISTD